MAFVDYGSEDTKKEDGPDLQNQHWKLYYDVTDDGKLHEKYKIKSPKKKNIHNQDLIIRSLMQDPNNQKNQRNRKDNGKLPWYE